MDFAILRQLLIGLVCNLLIIDSGFHEGWSTPMIPKLEAPGPLHVSAEQGAWIINLLYCGVGVGSAIPLLLMDRIGRKWTMMIAALPKIASWAIYALASNYLAFYAGRLLAGIGTGVSYCVTPMYIGEVSSKQMRGPLNASLAVWINIGMLLIYAIGMYASRLTMSLAAVVLPSLFLLSFMWLPTSAVFLAKKGRFAKAERSLQWSLGRDNVEQELEEIRRMVKGEEAQGALGFGHALRECARRPECRRAFAITSVLMGTMIFSGVAPILSYQQRIYDEAGFSISTRLSTLMSGSAIVLSGLACVLLVRRTGKRALLLGAAPLTALCLLVVGGFFALKAHGSDLDNLRWIPSAFIVLYALAYGVAINPLPMSYIGEIFPTDVKVPAALFTSIFYALGNLLVVKVYQVLQDGYGIHVPFLMFAGITACLAVSIYLVVPETEGKSLEEIQTELRRGGERSSRAALNGSGAGGFELGQTNSSARVPSPIYRSPIRG